MLALEKELDSEEGNIKVAFVAGATGYVGEEVVRNLISLGFRTVAHIRPDSFRLEKKKAYFEQLGAVVDTTPWELNAMTQTMKRIRPDAVYCLVGTTRARMKQVAEEGGSIERASYEAIDYGLTVLLARAASDSHQSPRFVYISAIGSTPWAKGSYMQAHYRAESAVLTSGLPYTVARPVLITGPDRKENRLFERVTARILDAVLAFASRFGLRRLWKKYASIDAASMAKALVKLANNPNCANRVVEAHELRDI